MAPPKIAQEPYRSARRDFWRRTELITIATDTTPLDGAFHMPEDRPVRGGVLLFHGNTMNFYVGAPCWLPPVLTELGFACLAFNRRGHES